MGWVVGCGDILEAVRERGSLRAPRWVETEEGSLDYVEGVVEVAGRTFTLEIPAFSALGLPKVYLSESDVDALIPHVSQESRSICFLDPEGVLIDRDRLEDVLAEAIERTKATIQKGLSSERGAEFVNEFQVYWSQLAGAESVFSLMEVSSDFKWAYLLTAPELPTYLVDSEEELERYHSGRIDISGRTRRKVPYFPLEEGTTLVPPRAHEGPWSPAQARSTLVPVLERQTRNKLSKILGGRTKSVEYVFFGLPSPQGGTTVFGLKFGTPGEKHPLLPDGSAEGTTAVSVARRDRGYLLPRGGGSTELSNKRALIVGCGAIGGYASFALARAGLVRQTLVDGDDLTIENAFRHVLGRRYLGKNKAKSLAEELCVQLPYVEAEGVPVAIEFALEKKTRLSDFDLVFVATGKPTVEMYLDERLNEIADGAAAVFAWVEPLGLGGHAVLTGVGTSGCLRCAFTPTSSVQGRLESRLAFAEQGVSYGRALAGCGSLHTPYGAVHASRTADMAAELGVAALTGAQETNVARSWVGDATAFNANGYKTSPRYPGTPGRVLSTEFDSPQCPRCAGVMT